MSRPFRSLPSASFPPSLAGRRIARGRRGAANLTSDATCIGPATLSPSWISITPSSVRTPREIFSSLSSQGYNVTYHRVPITRDQSPEDRYLDVYTTLLKDVSTSSALVFNCGIGVVRTTFAMSAAVMVRRKRVMLEQGGRDPLGLSDAPASASASEGRGGEKDEEDVARAKRVLKARNEQSRRDRSLLGLMSVLQKSEFGCLSLSLCFPSSLRLGAERGADE